MSCYTLSYDSESDWKSFAQVGFSISISLLILHSVQVCIYNSVFSDYFPFVNFSLGSDGPLIQSSIFMFLIGHFQTIYKILPLKFFLCVKSTKIFLQRWEMLPDFCWSMYLYNSWRWVKTDMVFPAVFDSVAILAGNSPNKSFLQANGSRDPLV